MHLFQYVHYPRGGTLEVTFHKVVHIWALENDWSIGGIWASDDLILKRKGLNRTFTEKIERKGPDLRCAYYNVHATRVCMLRA